MKVRKLSEAVKKTVAHSQGWLCKSCDRILPATYQVDHIIPHSVFLDDSMNNLQALCPNCHSRKTQREHMRIIRYKKKRALDKTQLCWFCISPVDEYMSCSCDRTLKPITFTTNKLSLINSFDKYCHISDIESSSSSTRVLNITLKRDKVIINGRVFHFLKGYDVNEVCHCVFVATRSKRYSNFFSEIELDIEFGEEPNDIEGLIKFLDTNLNAKLTKRIFSNINNVRYSYLIGS